MNGWLVSIPEMATGTIILLGLAAIITLGFCLGIYRKRVPQNRWLRIGLTVFAFGSICGLVLKPQWRVPQKPHSAVLLTTGYAPKDLKNFMAQHPEQLAAFALRDVKAPASFKLIPDLAWLHRNKPRITELHVFGYGFDPWDLHHIEGLHLVPHLSPLPQGMERVHWQREIRLGATLQIQGSLSQATGCSLTLEEPGGKQWALPLLDEKRHFRFETNPKAAGRFEYKLIVKDALGSVIQEEKLPVWVTENQPPKLLVLSSSPSFEIRFLKSWLTQGKGTLLVRTQVSQDRFLWSETESNHPEFVSLSKQVLKGFDLILLDHTALRNLKPVERIVLTTAIEGGLGLLLVPPNRSPDDKIMPLFKDFVLKPVGDLETREVDAVFAASTGTGAPLEAVPFEIEDHGNLQPLVWDSSQRILAAMTPRGNGAIGMTLTTNSYTWVMKETAQEHAAYWTHLIQVLARKQLGPDQWQIPDPWIWVHQPVGLTLVTTDPRPMGKVENSVQLPLRQDPMEPSQWSATWWPRDRGWHRLNHATGTGQWVPVFGTSEWRSVQRAQRLQATQTAATANRSPLKTTMASIWKHQPMPGWIFFLLFLASASGLWLEHKRSGAP